MTLATTHFGRIGRGVNPAGSNQPVNFSIGLSEGADGIPRGFERGGGGLLIRSRLLQFLLSHSVGFAKRLDAHQFLAG